MVVQILILFTGNKSYNLFKTLKEYDNMYNKMRYDFSDLMPEVVKKIVTEME